MPEPIRVVFVCVENSCRSQIAEGFARRLAPPGFEVYSAGSRASGKVDERALASMLEAGIDISGQQSKSLAELPSVTFTRAITMGCGDECPYLGANTREDWGLPDPKHMDDAAFRMIRDNIRVRVERLLAELAAQPNVSDRSD